MQPNSESKLVKMNNWNYKNRLGNSSSVVGNQIEKKRAVFTSQRPPPPSRSETPLPSSSIMSQQTLYAVIEDKRSVHANKKPIYSTNRFLTKKPPISVQNRPLPPVPPPRKSQVGTRNATQMEQNPSMHSSTSSGNAPSSHPYHPTCSDSNMENFDTSTKSDETNSVSSIYEQISPRKCIKSSVIVRTSKLQCQSGIPVSVPGSFSMAELATRFLEENVRNCIKPRIFPMESTSSFNERTSAPYIFAATRSDTRIHHQQKRLIFTPSLVMDGFLASKTALVSKTRSLTTSLGSFSQQNLQNTYFKMSSTTNGVTGGSGAAGISTTSAAPALENGSPAHKPGQNGARSDFASFLRKWSAPIPPTLSRKLGRTSESPLGKVKVMLRVCDNVEEVSSSAGILGLDKRKKQVTLIDPGGTTPSGITPQERRVGISAPKMFAFDGIFGEDDDQGEICAASAAELVASVVGGEDGCFVSLGYCSAGKKQTMFGKPANQKMGAVPTAISWLFKSILEQKQKTGSRFSVRVSAVEVTGGSGHEVINDLLLPFVNDGDDPPGALLENTSGVSTTNSKSISAPVLNSVSEVRAPNPETAGFFLDSALDTVHSREEPMGHFVFTLHVYQYSVDKNGKGVAGGRSRLHCVMLGNGSPSISVLGGLLLAVLNGQRHLPSSNHSKLGAILRECLGSLTCRAVVMIHVSNAHARYAETLAALQLGARVHRLRRSRRLKMGSVGSGNGSGGSSGGSGEDTRNALGVNNQVGEGETGSSDIDPSSSDLSCDTVIYLGPSIDEATDGEHPPVYLPSLETTPGENEAKIIPSKCPIMSGTANGMPPKTKSPKPKGTKITNDGNFGASNGKSEEQWVDGPKVAKYRQINGSHASGANNTVTSSQSPAKKKGETWIDGPAARVQHQGSNFPSPKKTPSNTQHQRAGASATKVGVNFSNGHCQNSQGRSSCDLSNCPSVCISATKAEMIQKWISNQTPSSSDLFDESPTHKAALDLYFSSQENCLQNGLGLGYPGALGQLSLQQHGGMNNGSTTAVLPGAQMSIGCCSQAGDPLQFANIYSCHCLNRGGERNGEPEYKALTVFKTCDDISTDGDHQSISNGYDFEFIEVVEPEVPVPTRDACLQVTEEDIALSFLDENPLPESDQNYEMSPETYFSRGRSNSFSEVSSFSSNKSMPKLENENDHPLRVLSQECLTVVSTFADSVSIAGGDMERFWPRLSFPHDLDANKDVSMYHGPGYAINNTSLSNTHSLSSKLEQMSTQNNKPPSSLLLRDLPILSDESIFKVPSTNQQKISKGSRMSAIQQKKYLSGKESSDTEGESIKIPPMELIDTTPITSSCNLPAENVSTQVQSITVALPFQPTVENKQNDGHSMCSPHRVIYEHSLYSPMSHQNGNAGGSVNMHLGVHLTNAGSGGSNNSVQSSPSRSTLTPPSSPSPSPLKLPDVTKSPSKSKSRKISKFFRTRSKSPKTAGATSSSESGKSSLSSDAKHSSSSSSCSSGVSAPLTMPPTKQKSHSSPKHMSPSRHLSPSKKQGSRKNSCFSTSTASSTDYHFTCDSVLPMFLPNPNQNKKIVGSTDLTGNGVITYN